MLLSGHMYRACIFYKMPSKLLYDYKFLWVFLMLYVPANYQSDLGFKHIFSFVVRSAFFRF